MPDDVTGTLAAVAAGLPGGGESRQGQQQMAEAVERAIEDRRHLVVQAGTGTGKSLAYLIPAALSGERIVVATATKALQDQLAHSDLPQVAAAVGGDFSFAVLKGRSNYLCRQRVSEIGGRGEQMTLAARVGRPARRRRPPHPAAGGGRDCGTGRPGRGGSARRPGPAPGAVGRRHHHRGPVRARVRAPLPGVGHGLDHRP